MPASTNSTANTANATHVIELLNTEKQNFNSIKSFLVVLEKIRKEARKDLSKHLRLVLQLNEFIYAFGHLATVLEQSPILRIANAYEDDKSIIQAVDIIIGSLVVIKAEFPLLLTALASIATNKDYFGGQLQAYKDDINTICDSLSDDKDISAAKVLANNSIIDFLNNNIMLPVQRITKYPLLFKEILKANNNNEAVSDNAKVLEKTITTSVTLANNAVTPHKPAEKVPSLRRIGTIMLDKDVSRKLFPDEANDDSADKSSTFEQGSGAAIEANLELSYEIQIKAKSIGLQRQYQQEEQAAVFIVDKILSATELSCKEIAPWQPYLAELRANIYEVYFRIKTCGLTSCYDAIMATIQKIKADKNVNDDAFVGYLESFITPDYLGNDYKRSQKLLSINVRSNLSPKQRENKIHTEILNNLFAAMAEFKHEQAFFDDNLTQLEANAYIAIFNDLKAIQAKMQSNNRYIVKNNNIWMDIIEIFQKHIHVAGEFPLYFYHGKFGNMLRKVAGYLDQIKPQIYRRAFELITAPMGYSYTDSYKTQEITVYTVPKEYLTPARLCLNIQRIMDFYCNTGLGKLVAEDVKSQKINLNQKWITEIKELDNKVTQIYLSNEVELNDLYLQINNLSSEIINLGEAKEKAESEQLSSLHEQIKEAELKIKTIMDKMFAAIDATVEEIKKSSDEKNNELAGSLILLKKLFLGESLPRENPYFNVEDIYDTYAHLPHGVISSTAKLSDEMVGSYINRHVVQRACSPFVSYKNAKAPGDFTNGSKVSLLEAEHTVEVVKEYTDLYYSLENSAKGKASAAANLFDRLKSIGERRLNSVVSYLNFTKEYTKVVNTSKSYLSAALPAENAQMSTVVLREASSPYATPIKGNNRIESYGRSPVTLAIDGNDDLDSATAEKPIQSDTLSKVLAVLSGFKKRQAYFNKHLTQLEANAHIAICVDLEVIRVQLEQDNNVKNADFWLDIVKIFQKHTHIAGEFPLYFYHSKFGDMLREVASHLDAVKPQGYRDAFEIITAPPGYSHMKPDETKEKVVYQIPEEHRTSARLCLNIQRIMDFYCNTGLGKLVSEDVQEQKLNLKQSWLSNIQTLDTYITQLYLANKGDNQALMTNMLEKIKEVAANIQKSISGKHSRLAGSLILLVKLFAGEQLTDKDYKAISHLPHGVISSTAEFDKEMIDSYITRHIAQRACKPFIKYETSLLPGFFKTKTEVSLLEKRHTVETTKKFAQLYDSQENGIVSLTAAGGFFEELKTIKEDLAPKKTNYLKYTEEYNDEAVSVSRSYLNRVLKV